MSEFQHEPTRKPHAAQHAWVTGEGMPTCCKGCSIKTRLEEVQRCSCGIAQTILSCHLSPGWTPARPPSLHELKALLVNHGRPGHRLDCRRLHVHGRPISFPLRLAFAAARLRRASHHGPIPVHLRACTRPLVKASAGLTGSRWHVLCRYALAGRAGGSVVRGGGRTLAERLLEVPAGTVLRSRSSMAEVPCSSSSCSRTSTLATCSTCHTHQPLPYSHDDTHLEYLRVSYCDGP